MFKVGRNQNVAVCEQGTKVTVVAKVKEQKERLGMSCDLQYCGTGRFIVPSVPTQQITGVIPSLWSQLGLPVLWSTLYP